MHLATEQDAQNFGRSLAASMRAGDVIALAGDLGAGKTQIAKGLAAGLGFTGDVTSPTFTLVHEYRGGRLPIFHFDFYRLDTADEALALGWEEYLDEDGVSLVEWPDKFPSLLPPHTQWWHITILPQGGRQVARASGPIAAPSDVARASGPIAAHD